MARPAARAEVLGLDVLGLRVALRSPVKAVRDAWGELFEPLRARAGLESADVALELAAVEGGWQLRVDGATAASRSEWPELQPVVVSEINRRAVEQMPWFGVHAGVVSAGPIAIAFPGESGRGKSTAVAACVAAGLSYGSDEALILAPDGRLVPYPRPISLSPEMARRFAMSGFGDRDEVAIAMTGIPLLPSNGQAQLEHVVLLRRTPATAGAVEERPRGDAVVQLLANSFNHYRDPGASLRLATEAARTARCWELVYDAPEDVPRLLRELLEPGQWPSRALRPTP